MNMVSKALRVSCAAAFAVRSFAAVIGGSNYVAEAYYVNPHADTRLVGFDWDNASNLYYAVGRADWSPGFGVYKRALGAAAASLYSDTNAFAGSRVTAIGPRIYFNDGGTYERWTCDYFKYDPAAQAAPTNMGVKSDIWGLETRDGTDFWASGGYSAAIYYSALDANGNLADNPLHNLGTIGAASGPMVFDANGNLYYAEGYVSEGHARVFRWTAAEVAAAIANPASAYLNPTGHVWATLSSGDGATSMAIDQDGHVLVTATSFTQPSELHRLFVSGSTCSGYEIMARSDERLETVRIRGGRTYVSSASGIFVIVSLLAQARPPNDYDGDGKSDLAVFDNAAGKWYAYSLARGQAIVWNVTWGWPGAVPVAGDYDGDGSSDLCVFDSNTGRWYAWSQTRQSQIMWEVGWGWPGAMPVAGDYDGDGVYDMAVFDAISGQWFIRTVSGTIITWATPWGWPGATPVGRAQ